MRYYRDTLKWNAGPHLFCDDLFIFLMSPMNQTGIHAKWGNSFTRNGQLHYSVGIEVIGDYTKVQWPASVQAVVRSAVQTLQRRLNTFYLDYMYSGDTPKPGSATDAQGNQYCPHPDRLKWGGISSHRDYNKPSCPGNAITEAFYMSVINPQPADPFAAWGPLGKPQGAAQGFAIPQCWLANQWLGACRMPEDYTKSDKAALALFANGCIVYDTATNQATAYRK